MKEQLIEEYRQLKEEARNNPTDEAIKERMRQIKRRFGNIFFQNIAHYL